MKEAVDIVNNIIRIKTQQLADSIVERQKLNLNMTDTVFIQRIHENRMIIEEYQKIKALFPTQRKRKEVTKDE